jgi:hypothetical protein
MRSRKGFFKRLLLSGATAVSLVGFASPAVFAWDGGGGNYDGNSWDNSYNNRCDMQYNSWNNWGGNNYRSDCYRMPKHYDNYSSYNNNNCDHNQNRYW